jgi:hypothetical protein
MKRSLYTSLTLMAMFATGLVAQAQWVAPPATAPTCPTTTAACNPPINTSATAQTKTGILTVGDGTIASKLNVNANWGAVGPAEQFTVRGSHPSLALRDTLVNNVWLYHSSGGNLNWYYGNAGLETTSWTQKAYMDPSGNFVARGTVYSNSVTVCQSNGVNCPGGSGGAAFGGMYQRWNTGACIVGNAYTGGCSCPAYAPNAYHSAIAGADGVGPGAPWNSYYCTN